MRLKLKVDLHDGSDVREVTTNMFVICEWEKTEGRKISDGKGIGYSDLVCWAYHLLKIGGEKLPPNYRDWETDRKSTRLNSSHSAKSRMPSSA